MNALVKGAVLHAFKLGPVRVGRGNTSLYAAAGDTGVLKPAFAATDEEGLRELVREAGARPLRCEPGLAKAARSLGLETARLPRGALELRAALAVMLVGGATDVPAHPVANARLLEAFAAFWKARPWERFDGDQPISITLTEGRRLSVREASVMGMGGREFGLAIYEKVGSVARLARFVDTGRVAEARKVDSIAVTLNDEPSFAVRAVEDAHGLPGVPVAIALRRSRVQPATPSDVLSLAAGLEAFARVMPDGREGSAVAEAGGDRCEAYVLAPEREAEADLEPPPSAPAGRSVPSVRKAPSRIPRNAPCPCGSGKKYKKCHLPEDEARRSADGSAEARRLAERDPIHSLDDRLTADILALASRRWGRRFDWERALEEAGIRSDDANHVIPWVAHHFLGPGGLTARDLFLRERGSTLPEAERSWLQAQAAARASVWEVVDAVPGESLTLRDLLGTEVRHVQEAAAPRSLVARDVILARVVDHGGVAFLCGTHARALPPREGAVAVRIIRTAVRSRARTVPAEKLRQAAADGRMLRLWQAGVESLDARPPPALHNTDGEPILLTADRFTLEPDAAAEVRERLLRIEGAEADEEDEDDAGPFRVTFTRPGNARHPDWENTIVGSAELSGPGLRVEANSVARADRLRGLVEGACGGLVRFRVREHSDPQAYLTRGGMQLSSRDGVHLAGPDAAAAVRDVKAGHYRAWVGQPIPALGGLSPREAASGKPKDRRALELLLAEIENLEARSPEAERFDVRLLRRELGLTAR